MESVMDFRPWQHLSMTKLKGKLGRKTVENGACMHILISFPKVIYQSQKVCQSKLRVLKTLWLKYQHSSGSKRGRDRSVKTLFAEKSCLLYANVALALQALLTGIGSTILAFGISAIVEVLQVKTGAFLFSSFSQLNHSSVAAAPVGILYDYSYSDNNQFSNLFTNINWTRVSWYTKTLLD